MAYHRSLTDEQVLEFAEMMHDVSNKELAKRFGISEATSCKYRQKAKGIAGKVRAKNSRLEAIKRGDKFYIGRPCKCGSVKRHISDSKCVVCRKKSSNAWKAKDKERKAKEEARKEQLAMIAHHKQNPQLSCVRWG